MRIENEVLLDYSDVLIRPKRSTLGSRSEVDLNRKFKFRNYDPHFEHESWEEDHYDGIPIMAANMDGVGTFEQADALAKLGMFTCLVKTYSETELVNFFDPEDQDHMFIRSDNVAMSIGITEKDEMKFRNVYEQVGYNLKYVCIDVANGYSERFVDYVKHFRRNYPHIVIIAGNVVTGEMTEELILAGADIVKVGIGPGSVCTTRIQTGVGYPQLSAVIECADAAHGLGGHIIADGGCTCPGDVAKAFAGGADFVMLGGMLAGHDESSGDIVEENGVKYKEFYGMSSDTAMLKHRGEVAKYRASEGKRVLIKYRGPIENTINDILGGVRSTCTYVGASKLKELSKRTTFVRVNKQSNEVFGKN